MDVLCVFRSIFILLLGFSCWGSAKIIKDKTDDDRSTNIVTTGSDSILTNLTIALFENYNPDTRPYCFEYDKVNVTVDLAVRQIISLDEPEQIVQLNIWMRLGWTDCHLRWDPDLFNGTDSIILPITSIWKPDITLYESIAEEFYGFENFRARINSDGYVSYNFPSKVEALCPVDVSKFPYDSQTCALMFGSWAYNGNELDVWSKHSSADLSSMKEHVEWIIYDVPTVRHVLYYGCCPEPFPDATFYVQLRRKPAYYVTNIIIPSILVTLIASLGFLLPVDSGEKVGLELTVMLAMSVFQLLVADQLPPSADSIPWIGIFFSFTLVLSGLSSLWQVLVLNIHYRGDRKMPDWVKYNILKPLAYISCVKLPRIKNLYKYSPKQDKKLTRLFNILERNRKSQEGEMGSTTTIENLPEIEESELWMKFSITLDRIGLILFLLSFVVGCCYIFLGIHKN